MKGPSWIPAPKHKYCWWCTKQKHKCKCSQAQSARITRRKGRGKTWKT